MFRLSRFPMLKATSFKIMPTNYFQSRTKLPFACINIATLLVKTLFNKLLKCLIQWNPKARRLILKAPQSLWNFTHGTAAQQLILLSNYRAIGVFLNINIAASILQESWCQLSPNRYRSAGRNEKMAPWPILWIRHGHPPPHHHRTAIMETHIMKTLKPQNPLRSAATAPLPLRTSGNVP